MNAKAVAKKYNEIMSDKSRMNKLYNESFTLDDCLQLLSNFMEAIIGSDGKVPSHFIRTPHELSRFFYGLELSDNDLQKNILSNPILCHAFNGVNLEKVIKYGLGSEKIIDEDIAKKMDTVEAHFGHLHNYYNYQLNSRNEIYVGFPGFSEMEFATKFSPERLFLGLLYQRDNECLPMIMGETKKGYYTRVLDNNIDKLECKADKDMLKSLGHEIVDKFCTKRPIIALFDTYSKNYNLVARDFERCIDIPIEKYLKINLKFFALGNPIDVFSRNKCGKNIFEVDDIAICDNIIPPTSLGLVEVPDGYELRQYLAYVKGAKMGDLVDFQSGKRVEENGIINVLDNKKEKEFVDVLNYFKKAKLVESEFERLSKKEMVKTNLKHATIESADAERKTIGSFSPKTSKNGANSIKIKKQKKADLKDRSIDMPHDFSSQGQGKGQKNYVSFNGCKFIFEPKTLDDEIDWSKI